MIGSSSDSASWGSSVNQMAEWQRGVLTRLHVLTLNDEIEYLSSAKVSESDWDFVAFTDNRVIRVLVFDANRAPRFETSTFPRDSLESLELLDVDAIPVGADDWPGDVNLIGHYRAGSVPLPLDRFASSVNKQDLIVLMRSLLQDLTH